MEFKIQRYQGIEEDEEVSKEKQIDLFQARIEERRRKRKSLLQENVDATQCSEENGEIKQKKMKKMKDAETDSNDSNVKKKKKKKKKKHLEDASNENDSFENDPDSTLEVKANGVVKVEDVSMNIEGNDSSVDVKKKKKKKKHKDVAENDNNMNVSDMAEGIETGLPKKHKKTKSEKEKSGNSEEEEKVMDIDNSTEVISSNDDITEHEEPMSQTVVNGTCTVGDDVGNDDGVHGDTQTEEQNEEKNVQSENYFPILGKHNKTKKTIVKRSLPRWLNEPIFMSADINFGKVAIKDVTFLSETISANLQSNDIEYLFPVQYSVGEKIMSQNKQVISKYPPRDICVQAPTGSGKTLSYVLPIIDVLSKYIIRQLYCLVVVPSKDLAVQVHKVFESYVKGTQLKVGLASGLKTFSKEQEKLVTKRENEGCSKVNIIVATPGRLVDHLKQTPGFNLKYLRFLIVDEADRLLGQDYSGWLEEIKASVYSSDEKHLSRSKIIPVNAAAFLGCQMPFQKLLFSATLTKNPEKLAALELFHPILFTSKHEYTKLEEESNDVDEQSSVAVDRFIIPENLEEKMVVVEADQKPLVLVHLMVNLKWKGVLCFTNSVSATHRLCLLLQSFEGFTVAEFSSNLSEAQRKGIIRDFNNCKVDLLISSDAMARGMDIDSVRLVVNYDTAANTKTYVHRVGRTARAGKDGSALTILQSKEVYHFKLMMTKLSGKVVPKQSIPKDVFKSYQEQYENALSSLHNKISIENRNTNAGNYAKRT